MNNGRKICSLLVVSFLILCTFLAALPTTHVQAALTHVPTAWSNFTLQPYLLDGNPVYDQETSADTSRGPAAVQPDAVDIASGAAVGAVGPGTEPSVLLAYYDGGTPGDANYTDDFYAFRVRLGDDPQHGPSGGYRSYHWDVLIDIDGDGWKEFVIDLSGEFSGSSPDRLYVFYNNNDTQTYNPSTDQVDVFYAANNTATGDPQTYNHSRVVNATGGLDPNQKWLDFQIPLTALENNLGLQQVLPSTLIRLFYSTSASNTNPLQKDWMRQPFSFGDPLNPNVEATKTDSLFNDADSSGGYTPGDTILYTVVITNDGNLDATGVTFSDTPDANTTLVVGSVTTTQGTVTSGNTGGDTSVGVNIGTLTRGGGSLTITFKVTINSPLVPPETTQISSQGTVSGSNIADEPTDDPGTPTDDDPTITPLSAEPDLSIAKSDSPDPVIAGNNLTYTLTATNNGPSNATGVVVTDTLPAGATFVSAAPSSGTASEAGGVVTWNVGNLASGASATLTIVVTVNSSTTGTLTNQASITGNESDPNTANNTDTENTNVVTQTDLAISKGDSPDPVIAGNNLTYTLTASNNGPSGATNVVVTDNLPLADISSIALGTPSQGSASESGGVVTWNVGGVSNGASAILTIAVTVKSSTAHGAVISNTATVSATETDPDPSNNTVTQSTTVNRQTDLQVSKTDSPDPVMAGNDLTYTITVKNNGPSDATGVQVTDTLPGGVTYKSNTPSQGSYTSGTGVWDVGSLSNGASATLALVVTVDSETTGIIANSVSATGEQTDPNPNNNTGVTAQTTIASETDADLEVTKTDNPDPMIAGNDLTYTITVKNNGPSDATGVQVTDTLPGGVTYKSNTPSQGSYTSGTGVWDVGSLASGASATLTLVVTVNSSTTAKLTNEVTVSGNETDPNSDNDTYSEDTGVNTETDLGVTMTDSPDPVIVGHELTYTITVTNNGPSNATVVVVTDTLPAGAIFVSAAPSSGTASEAGGVVTWNVGNLASGASATLTIVVTVNSSTTGTLTNETSISGNETDPDLAKNSDTEQTTVTQVSAAPAISVGGIVEFPVGGSGSSSPPYAVIIGGAMAALAALALGVWFARRRWLRRCS